MALGKQVEITTKVMKDLSQEAESLKKELEENETYIQLTNLERKLQVRQRH